MDETSGGTMTPPHDQDATSEDFAPVILLRPRPQQIDAAEPSETSEPDSRGIWDLDAPLAGLTERPSVWEQPTATELLAPAASAATKADAYGRETTLVIPTRAAGFTRVAQRRLAQITGVAAVLATTAVVIVLADDGSHRHATHVATGAPARVLKHTVTRAARVGTKPSIHAHRATAKTATHSRPIARHPGTRSVRHTAVTAAKQQSPLVLPASGSPPSAPPTQQTTPPSAQPAVSPTADTAQNSLPTTDLKETNPAPSIAETKKPGNSPAATANPAAKSKNPNMTPSGPATNKPSAQKPPTEPESEAGEQEYLQAQEILKSGDREGGSQEAVRLLWIAVEKGNSKAEVSLAELYRRGEGVARNCDQTRILLTAAARKGNAEAQRRLETFLREGCE